MGYGVFSNNRVLGNATNGMQFDLTDSNLGGQLFGNTIENNAGDGVIFNADSASDLRTLYFHDPETAVGSVLGASNHDVVRISADGHGLATGDLVYIEGVTGNVVANGNAH